MSARRAGSRLTWLAVAGALSCVHAEPLPPPVTVRAPAVVRVAPAPAEPLTPLELPQDLVFLGRWRNPSQLLEKLTAWAGGDRSLERFLRERVGQPAEPVDLTLPVELLVVLDRTASLPRVSWALSLGLALPGAREPRAELPGRFAAPPRDVASPSGFSCATASALGPAAERMVCAGSDDELARLLPAATRAVPLQNIGTGDVALALRAEPLRAVDDQSLEALARGWLSDAMGVSSVNARFDAQLVRVVQGLAREVRDLGEDLDGSLLELSLRPDGDGLGLSWLAPAVVGRSALGQLLIGSGASGLAPPEFWQTHAASEDAGFFWAFEATPLKRLRDPLADLMSTVLDFRGVPARLGRLARYLVQVMPLPRGPLIHASGRLPDESAGGVPAPAWLSDLGWQYYGIVGNFSEYQFYVAELAKAFNDPILGPQFGRLLRGALGQNWAPLHLRQRRPSGGSELPHGSFTLEVTFAVPRAPEPDVVESPEASFGDAPEAGSAALGERTSGRRTPTLFIVFVPDDDGLKIAWGSDERFLVSLVSEAGRSRGTATLAGRAGLNSLHEHRTLAGGFYSLAALAEIQAPTAADSGSWNAPVKALLGAPHRGLSPIVYTLSQPPDATSLALSASLGRDTLEDLLFLFGAATAR